MKNRSHSISVRRLIKQNRARVFRAFSEAESLSQWFTPSADISVEVLAFEFVAQGAFRLRYTMPDGSQPVVGGFYELIEPPAKIVFSWVWEAPDPHAGIPTRVSVQLLEKGQATEIAITHEQLASREASIRHAEGWEGMLNVLTDFLEELNYPKTRNGTDA